MPELDLARPDWDLGRDRGGTARANPVRVSRLRERRGPDLFVAHPHRPALTPWLPRHGQRRRRLHVGHHTTTAPVPVPAPMLRAMRWGAVFGCELKGVVL